MEYRQLRACGLRVSTVVDALVEIGDGGVSAAQVALAWPRDRPGVSSVIVGARTDEQLADNLGAADLLLGADEIARLDEVSRSPLIYPDWHQAKTASDRLSGADLALLESHLAGQPRICGKRGNAR